MSRLQEVLRTVQLRVKTHGAYFSAYETRTKYALIDPVLRGLGWALSSPTQVQFEFKIPDSLKRADYALFNKKLSAMPVAIIEAKKYNPKGASYQGIIFSETNWLWSLTQTDEDQLNTYSVKLSLQSGYGALTNGNEWRIYDLSKRGEFSDMIVANVRVLNDPVEDCAATLSLLSRHNPQWPGLND